MKTKAAGDILFDPTVQFYFLTQRLVNITAVRHRQHLVQFIIGIFFK